MCKGVGSRRHTWTGRPQTHERVCTAESGWGWVLGDRDRCARDGDGCWVLGATRWHVLGRVGGWRAAHARMGWRVAYGSRWGLEVRCSTHRLFVV